MSEEKQKILLVDDEVDILEFISYNLEKDGYQVFTAQNGVDAIRIAEKKIPDLIILDVMMPEMDGIAACEEIRKIPALQNTNEAGSTLMFSCAFETQIRNHHRKFTD